MDRVDYDALERDSTEVVVAPYHLAMLRRAKAVERQIELEWENMNVLQADAGPRRPDIAHVARKH